MIYHYKVVNETGQVIEDLMAATNQREVADSLKTKGLVVLEVVSEEEWKAQKKHFSLSDVRFGTKVPTIEKISFARHLAVMIKAGLPMAESLDILASDTNNPKLKKILTESRYGLESGKPLSICLSNYPEIFDKGFINMLKAGEISGRLAEVLEHVSQKLQQDYDLVSHIKAAMMYPLVIFCALVLVGIIMLVIVVPKIADVFTRLRVAVPLPTKILLFISKIFVAKPLVSIFVLLIVIIILVLFFRSLLGKRFLALLVHTIPVIKKLAKQIDLSRFNHSLSLMLKSGVPITSALGIAAETISNERMRIIIIDFQKKVTEGKPLAQAFRETSEIFPMIMVRMISVGEKTGKLEEILEELADFYRKETEQSLQTIANLVEPILMFVIGIVIGAMVLAIIGPMYSIVQQISK